jgi:hypothetical protein
VIQQDIVTRAFRALDQLRAIAEEATTATVTLAAAEGPQPLGDLRQMQLAGAAPQSFLEAARAAAMHEMVHSKPFEFGYTPEPHEVFVIDLTQYPEMQTPISRIARVDAQPLFDGAREFVSRFKAFATVLAPRDQTGVFLRRAGPKKELGRTKSIALLFQDGTFNKVTDRLFLFDQDVDLMATPEIAFVLNPSVLPALFPTFAVATERIEQTLTEVAPLIRNFDVFQQAVRGQLQMRTKMMQIGQRPYLARLTVNDLKVHIARRGLAITVEAGPDGREALVFDANAESRWLILKLLDDDYLDSVLTHEQYEVNSKSRTGATT